MAVNEITEVGKKRVILLSSVCAATCKLISNLTTPRSGYKMYKDLVELAQGHYICKHGYYFPNLKHRCTKNSLIFNANVDESFLALVYIYLSTQQSQVTAIYNTRLHTMIYRQK